MSIIIIHFLFKSLSLQQQGQGAKGESTCPPLSSTSSSPIFIASLTVVSWYDTNPYAFECQPNTKVTGYTICGCKPQIHQQHISDKLNIVYHWPTNHIWLLWFYSSLSKIRFEISFLKILSCYHTYCRACLHQYMFQVPESQPKLSQRM